MSNRESKPHHNGKQLPDRLIYSPTRAVGALLSRPWLLGYILMIQTAFQGLIIAHWGLVGNFLTVLIAGLFLLAVFLPGKNPRDVVFSVLGTRTQQFAAIFVFCLVITMVWGNHSFQAFLSLGQKITFLVIMAAVIETMRREQRLTSCAWIISGTVALLFTLVLIEYYFGIDLTLLDEKWNVPRDFCAGINHVRMTHLTIDNVYGTNRLAFYAILPVALGVGLILTSTRLLPKLIAGALVSIVIFGVVLSGSRSGTFAILVTFSTLILINIRSWRNVARYTIASSAIFGSVILLLWLLPVGVTSLERIFENDALSRMLSGPAINAGLCTKAVKATPVRPRADDIPDKVIDVRNKYNKGLTIDDRRIRNWKIALEVFRENPIGGSGFRTSTLEVLARIPDAKITDPHSGYLMVLSEAGLLGTLPLLALLFYSLTTLARPLSGVSGKAVIWKTVFLSALTGMLAANLTASYLFERYLWIVLAFAVVVEIWRQEKPGGDQTA